jgi:hypothetical protein
MADVPLTALGRFGLAHTGLAAIDHSRATCGTLRPRLLKIGAVVTLSVRSIRIAMPPACSNAAGVPSRAPDHRAESAPSAAATASNNTEPASGETSADPATALLARSSDRRSASGKNHCHAQSWRAMRAKADPLMPSANPAAAHGAAAPTQREVAINDAVDALDNAINRALSVVMADADFGLSASQGNRQGLIMLMGEVLRVLEIRLGCCPAGR